MQVNISNLTWEQFIYPRGAKSEKTISAYIEALAIGAQFPPIKIQRVFNYPQDSEKIEARLILDGIHRWFAFKENGIKKIAAVEWKDKSLDYEKSKTALLLESAKCNISHGDRLSPGDKKRIAREIATSDQECKWTEKALAERLGVIQQTVNAWISDIRARQRAGREIIIIRLNRLGWSQEMIAKVVGLDRSVISRNVQNTKISDMHNLLSQGHDMDHIARHFQSTPASQEKPDKSITIFDYHRILSKAGWKVTHRIECPPPAQLNRVPFQVVQPGYPLNA